VGIKKQKKTQALVSVFFLLLCWLDVLQYRIVLFYVVADLAVLLKRQKALYIQKHNSRSSAD